MSAAKSGSGISTMWAVVAPNTQVTWYGACTAAATGAVNSAQVEDVITHNVKTDTHKMFKIVLPMLHD